jgi:hypothetical protein
MYGFGARREVLLWLYEPISNRVGRAPLDVEGRAFCDWDVTFDAWGTSLARIDFDADREALFAIMEYSGIMGGASGQATRSISYDSVVCGLHVRTEETKTDGGRALRKCS